MTDFKSINITFGGEAGDGILSMGEILSKVFFQAGYKICTYKNFPSRIRGGHSSYSVRISNFEIKSRSTKTDILIAFDEETFNWHNNELTNDSIVFYDPAKVKNIIKPTHCNPTYIETPFLELANKNFNNQLFKNTIMIGTLLAIFNIKWDIIEKSFKKVIESKKGSEILEQNLKACNLGINFYNENISNKTKISLDLNLNDLNNDEILITGNEATVLGAIASGCKFISAYPISPATEIFEMMCNELPKHGGVTLQAEDEIAALCFAIGAGFAGARSMTSTSGPGISLMAEAIGLSACAEVPVVILDAQRPGPSTGLPTKTEQGDFYHTLFCTHGDAPRIVISISNVDESFYYITSAFNLAEIAQCPVILLTEQAIAQNKFVTKKFDYSQIKIDRGKLLTDSELLNIKNFLRYEFTNDGISNRAIPLQPNGIHLCNGNEHLESGRITENPEIRTKITQKRMKKLETILNSPYLPKPKFFGNPNAKIGIIGTGSAFNAFFEASTRLNSNNFYLMQMTTLMPFPKNEVNDFVSKCEKIIVVENNYSAQLSNIIKMNIPIHNKIQSILKYDGLAFSVEEAMNKLMEVK